jgi:hypothetical protein
MSLYRVLFFNHAGQVFSEKPFDADDDRGAIDYARRAFCTDTGLGYEIRQGQCLIIRVFFGSQPKAA